MKRPILCYVTDRKLLSAADTDPITILLEYMANAARAGVDWIQLREKDLEGGALFDLATAGMARCAAASGDTGKSAQLLINDRLDVAWAAQAAGVHLGEDSMPVAETARWRRQSGRRDFLFGVSCHSLEAAEQATSAGADYIFFGPVFATPSKQSFGPPQGLQKLEQVCRAVTLPVLAIGGVTAENAGACLRAGASGIAAIRLFQQPPELVTAAIAQIRS
jgi:thiamine-phosphate pyrophosphorylase